MGFKKGYVKTVIKIPASETTDKVNGKPNPP
jgi:hypothetical protein